MPTRITSLLWFVTLSALAGELAPTPADDMGPFYPDLLPADADSDLVQNGSRTTPARGERIELAGRVTDTRGQPLPGLTIELWQADAGGRYIHSGDPVLASRDPGFQGFGRARTDAMGRYRFLTVIPGGYSSRPPHFHVRLVLDGKELLVTQLYLPGLSREAGMPAAVLSGREAAQSIRLERRERLIPSGQFDFIVERR